ncbi:MAG TPA: metalloregulator ArsR/SmtB family transcription factor [Devosia sp.]|jgi:DNA-binding transcriptional ArsR family regulator|uniref:ArsR/SmtB family transcription factor n=1 Tax=Devosia sp. TaxID=1871048 RepID=UPI002F92A28D
MTLVQEPQSGDLTAVFLALADPTRRAVIKRLSQGPASVSDLASPFRMRLPSFMKHVRILEMSGMIRTAKSGRIRMCMIDAPGLTRAEIWLAEQRAIWEAQTDRLEAFLMQEQSENEASNVQRGE